MGLRSFFCFGSKKGKRETQGRPAATLTNISYPIHVLTTNPIGDQYPQYFMKSSGELKRTANETRRGEEAKTGGRKSRWGRERRRRSDMSFSCVGSEGSDPPPPPPPPLPLAQRYTGARDNHPSILAPTNWDAWAPPPGMELKTDVICFSCRKAPGRDAIGLCRNCSPVLSNPNPRDSRFTISNYYRDSFCMTNTASRHTSQHGGMILEAAEVVEDDSETDYGTVDFSDAYYAIMYEEWLEQEEQNVRREEERIRKRRNDKKRERGRIGMHGVVGYDYAGGFSMA
ncbi:hypothetical protein B9Z19DRAFT_1064986 [Tuber borchii]|uniref:Uncharacterized protein n=1 Tax=Tuber borchii TaxID=42251 RepID=A0A2T6ZSS5_TUBBO|nr:hypothetical protein B9Z19DRAFT_1064986 [Tuber borchii]